MAPYASSNVSSHRRADILLVVHHVNHRVRGIGNPLRILFRAKRVIGEMESIFANWCGEGQEKKRLFAYVFERSVPAACFYRYLESHTEIPVQSSGELQSSI